MTGNNCVEGEVVTTIKKGKTLNLELQKKTVIEEALLKYYNTRAASSVKVTITMLLIGKPFSTIIRAARF